MVPSPRRAPTPSNASRVGWSGSKRQAFTLLGHGVVDVTASSAPFDPHALVNGDYRDFLA